MYITEKKWPLLLHRFNGCKTSALKYMLASQVDEYRADVLQPLNLGLNIVQIGFRLIGTSGTLA